MDLTRSSIPEESFPRSRFAATNPFLNGSMIKETMTISDLSQSIQTTSEALPLPLNLNFSVNQKLSIFQHEKQIKAAIRQNQIIILTGSTGCGKTTQVPKMIAEDCVKHCETFNILITQPRRIAAITNSQRVAEEICCSLGSTVGYQVGLHKELNKATESTNIVYCTTGVILQKLIRSQSLKNYSHIVLDEIHERDIDMDFLLILIRGFMRKSKTKIILMSASMDTEIFSQYFGDYNTKVPIISMDVDRPFDLKILYLDDLNGTYSSRIIDYGEPIISEELMNLAAKIVYKQRVKNRQSSILVFLPGFYEIEKFEKVLEATFDVSDYEIIVLHSTVTPDDQKQAFRRDSKPKIILSTNIAENSVTIPNVNVVIDFCLTKYLVTDEHSNIASLKLDWTSKTSCIQRAGRTGRVCNGTVFRLVEKDFFKFEMEQFTKPEMLRISLESVVLKSKLVSDMAPAKFLSSAISPPPLYSIRNAILILKEVGALLRLEDNGNFNPDDGELSYLGRVLSSLPCDIYIGKLIMLGYAFGVLEDLIIIGAGLTINGSIFCFDLNDRLKCFKNRMEWSKGSGSDLLAILNAYKAWQFNVLEGKWKSKLEEDNWLADSYLNRKNMHEMRELIKEMKQRLESLHVLMPKEKSQPIHEEEAKPFMIQICIAGAFIPFYFIQTAPSDTTERDAFLEVNDQDVRRSFYFRDVEQQYIGLYNDILKKEILQLGICRKTKDIDISFSGSSKKIIVAITRDETMDDKQVGQKLILAAGKILPEVYLAVKFRELKKKIMLRVIDHEGMKRLAEQVDYKKPPDSVSFDTSISTNYENATEKMTGAVVHVENCKKFFFRPSGKSYDSDMLLLNMRLKMSQIIEAIEIQLSEGKGVVVNFGGKLERAIVIKPVKDGDIMFNLIDLGLCTVINIKDVFVVDNLKRTCLFDLPPRCFECRLKGIEPAVKISLNGVWSQKSTEHFKSLVNGKSWSLEVNSVIRGVAAVTLSSSRPVNSLSSEDLQTVNSEMVNAVFADECDEDLVSRSFTSLRSFNQLSFNTSTFSESQKTSCLDFPKGMSNMSVELLGPYSPLESELRSMFAVSNQAVKVDTHSVNSVILNGDINKIFSRLYIAANVTKNKRGMTLREVTMTPSIPGFPELSALIFSAQIRLKRNSDETRYETLLAGLGCHSDTKESLLKHRDAILPVSVCLTDSDFDRINELRSNISLLLYTDPKIEYPELTNKQKMELQMSIKENVLKIFDTKRKVLGESQGPQQCSWEAAQENIRTCSDTLGHRALYTSHCYPKLFVTSPEAKKTMKRQLSQVKAAMYIGEGKCPLCKESFNSIKERDQHFASLMHNKKVETFFS